MAIIIEYVDIKHMLSSVYVNLFLSFLILTSIGLSSSMSAQTMNLGSPQIDNFSPQDYKGGTQNWRLDLSPDGRIYAANNEGLLVFDGNEWEVYPLPNKTIVRSVAYYNDTILVGGQDELGYFVRDSFGRLKYNSLWHLIPDTLDITDIWDIQRLDNATYFRNYKHVFRLTSSGISLCQPNGYPEFLSVEKDVIRYNATGGQIYEVGADSKETSMSLSGPILSQTLVKVMALDEGRLIFTADDGIFFMDARNDISKWPSNAQRFLVDNKTTCVVRLKNGGFAVGTRQGGVLVLDEKGKALYVLDKTNGLQDNNVISIIEDESSNLWVGTFFGIDRIRFGSGMYTFFPDGEFQGAVFDVELWKDNWWFATSNGLYTIPNKAYALPFEEPVSTLVEGSDGQAWGLDIIDDQLFMAHHNGAYLVNEKFKLTKLDIHEGVWKFIQIDSDYIAVGSYIGIYFLKKMEDGYKYLCKLEDFKESSRIMMMDNTGHLWMSHPYRGLFRIEIRDDHCSSTVKSYFKESGYECQLGNYIFNVSGVPIVTNSCGIFSYSFNEDGFQRVSNLESTIGESQRVIRLFDKDDGLWYIAEGETCILPELKDSQQSAEKKCIPHIGKSYVGGFENLVSTASGDVVLCTNRGIIFYHQSENDLDRIPVTEISEMSTVNDRMLNLMREGNALLQPSERKIKFKFRAVGFIHEDLKGYQYRLIGHNDEWVFTNLTFKEYDNLEAGRYTFYVRAVTMEGKIGETAEVTFEIKRKWYQTKVASFLFLMVLVALLTGVWLWKSRQYKEKTENLLLINEKVEVELENVKEERLRDEIRFKNQELTSTTLHLLQKEQTINALRTGMKELQRKTSDPKLKKEINNIMGLLMADDRLETNWEKFSLLFDQVHVDFLARLKQKYPQLRSKDHKLCAFLRMNLSTKEIAPLLNISIRGVEISRYRLRKKLGLTKDDNLTDVILSI